MIDCKEQKDKIKMYELLCGQINEFLNDNTHIISKLSNVSALIFDALSDVNWAGFYLNLGEKLTLGPFQGKVACVEIPIGKGVCGTAAKLGETQLVEDVHKFAGHIACDAASNSEIVVPIKKDGNVLAVLDIDSTIFSRFDEIDKKYLEIICERIQEKCNFNDII